MTHIDKGIINEADVDILLGSPSFLYDPVNVGNLISGSSSFSKSSLYIWKFSIQVLLKPSLKDFYHNLQSVSLVTQLLLFEILRFGACQAPLSMWYSRQGYWSGLPFLSPALFLTSFNVVKILSPLLMCDRLLLSGPHHECENDSESRSAVSHSLPPHGLYQFSSVQ